MKNMTIISGEYRTTRLHAANAEHLRMGRTTMFVHCCMSRNVMRAAISEGRPDVVLADDVGHQGIKTLCTLAGEFPDVAFVVAV